MENEGFQVCAALGDLAESLKVHQGWTSVWKAKCKELAMKMKDFRCVRCWRFARTSLKSHKDWASVWRAKCKELAKKMKDFSVCAVSGFWRVRRKCTKDGPQYGEQKVRNSKGK